MSVSEERRLYRVPEAAALLGISRSKMWNLVHDDTIKSVKIGRCVLVAVEDLEGYVQRLRSA